MGIPGAIMFPSPLHCAVTRAGSRCFLNCISGDVPLKNYICKHYVNDHLGIYLEQPPGTRQKEYMNTLFIDPTKVEEDSLISADVRTMKLVCQLANMINPRIKMVYDCPSLHVSGKMPILNLQCWVTGDGFLEWELYRKPMSNPLMHLSVWALPAKVRQTTHS